MMNGGEGTAIPVDVFDLAARWRSCPEWRKLEDAIDWEPTPSHLNTTNSSGLFCSVSTDKMSVKYLGLQQHGHDVGVVQADCAAPTKRVAYYFEMTVKNAGQKGQMSIGFTSQSYSMRRQPGWEANSCGYHGDDGLLYLGQGKGETFGPKFTSGDTVGAGINYGSQEFFFTKNGRFVGTASKDIKGPLFSTVAVHSQNEEVTVNFGKQPFLFDIQGYILAERLEQRTTLEDITLLPNISHWIIRSYLLHYGYVDTLESYDIASESMCPPIRKIQQSGFHDERDTYELSNRKILRQFIKKGDIDAAFLKLREWYPQAVQEETSVICFLLHSQRYIEYIRAGDETGAMTYAQAELYRYFDLKPFTDLCAGLFALLAYEKPQESCLGYFLDMSQRDFVADAVNTVVLLTNPDSDAEKCMQTCLEKLMRQLTTCTLEYRALSGTQGEAFFLHRELSNSQQGKKG